MMEQIFIQKIYKLTEQIIGREYEFDKMHRDLNNHLAKARRINAPLYEAETLNTFGILYGVEGDLSQQMHYFKTALEHGYDLGDARFIIKISNNLGSLYSNAWDLEQAQRVLKRGVDLIEQHAIRNLPTVYIYANLTDIELKRGDFATAETYHDTGWACTHNIDLENYSKMEYFQIVIVLQQQKAMLDIFHQRGDDALSTLRLIHEQTSTTARTDLTRQIDWVRLYHALICQQDEAAARTIEADLKASNDGRFVPDNLLSAAHFLFYNQQKAWAERYATTFITQADDKTPPMMIQHARHIQQNASPTT